MIKTKAGLQASQRLEQYDVPVFETAKIFTLTPVVLLINSLNVKGAGITIAFKVSSGASGGTGIAANTAYLA